MRFPKTEEYRDRGLLDDIRELPCQFPLAHLCDTPVEPSHSNQGIDGKAWARKSDDFMAAAICHTMHHELDQGQRWTYEEKCSLWDRAWRSTVRELFMRRKIGRLK